MNKVLQAKEGDRVESTQWYNLVAFGSVASFVKKGQGIAVEGEFKDSKCECG